MTRARRSTLTSSLLATLAPIAVAAATLAACVPPQGGYGNGGYAGGNGYNNGYAGGGAAASPGYAGAAASPGAASPAAASPGERHQAWNGHAATADDLAIVAQLEQAWGRQLPDGAYWYDDVSGAAGGWGGPTQAFLPAGLHLGGPLPAEASGGGDGSLTGVFINGRELHPIDVAGLQRLVGQVYPGRWWMNAAGDFGAEGGPALGNVVQIARQAQARGGGGDGSPYYQRGGGSAYDGAMISPGCSSVGSATIGCD